MAVWGVSWGGRIDEREGDAVIGWALRRWGESGLGAAEKSGLGTAGVKLVPEGRGILALSSGHTTQISTFSRIKSAYFVEPLT